MKKASPKRKKARLFGGCKCCKQSKRKCPEEHSQCSRCEVYHIFCISLQPIAVWQKPIVLAGLVRVRLTLKSNLSNLSKQFSRKFFGKFSGKVFSLDFSWNFLFSGPALTTTKEQTSSSKIVQIPRLDGLDTLGYRVRQVDCINEIENQKFIQPVPVRPKFIQLVRPYPTHVK